MTLYADSTNTNIKCVRSNRVLTCTICDRVFVAQVKAINKKLDHLLRHAPVVYAHDLGIADSQGSQGSIKGHFGYLGVERRVMKTMKTMKMRLVPAWRFRTRARLRCGVLFVRFSPCAVVRSARSFPTAINSILNYSFIVN